ncbi:MAG: hypothetical protein ABIH46_01940 [Chloroflexota bacterium]
MAAVAKTEELLNPIGEFEPEDVGLAPRPSDLNNKVIGLLDNSMMGAEELLARTEQLLSERYKFARVFKTKKPKASMSLPEAEMDKLVACDVVVAGIGL